MRFINIPYEDFLKKRGNRKIIQFGASSAWRYYLNTFPDITSEILDNTIFIVDNDRSKQEQKFMISHRSFPVERVEKLKEVTDCVILITVSLAYQINICRQLVALGLPEDTECYSLPLMTYSFRERNNTCVDEYFALHTSRVNRAVLHSFWFSGEEKPELYRRCVDSWRRFCPDFEIIEWNTSNYDVTKNSYMREAFENRKWAFVSDYARLDILYQYGGIYMDMDVELVAPIHCLLQADSFFCRQEDGYLELGSGFGAKAGDSLIGEMLETYRNRKFILEDGRMDKTPQPEWLSEILEQHGIYKGHDSQVLKNCLILSNDYISSFEGEGSFEKARFGVHWHNGGWLDEKDRRLMKDSYVARGELIAGYFKNGEY